MRLFRVFSWDGRNRAAAADGPLYVPRRRQGAGRHDAPDQYGALYCSLDAASAVAEAIQFLRGHELTADDLRRSDGLVRSLGALELDPTARLVDLDDPQVLASRGLRPSRIATLDRRVTQPLARTLYGEGLDGLSWWSTLDAGWTNVTLFHERVLPRLRLVSSPEPLTPTSPTLVEAARRLGIKIGARR